MERAGKIRRVIPRVFSHRVDSVSVQGILEITDEIVLTACESGTKIRMVELGSGIDHRDDDVRIAGCDIPGRREIDIRIVPLKAVMSIVGNGQGVVNVVRFGIEDLRAGVEFFNQR